MLYSKQKKWVFIHVPKNAGTSFKSLFTKCLHTEGISKEEQKQNKKQFNVQGYYQEGYDTEHNKWAYWQNVFVDFTPIAFLRNPWARALSTYMYSLQHAQKNLLKEWGFLDHARLSREGFKGSWMEGGFFVDDHAKEFEQNKKTLRNWQFGDTQASWLNGAGQWFRMEDQQKQFSAYTGTPELPVMNKSTKSNYRLYYDQELIERIRTLFAEDVELGKYNF
tara:strand:+ start:364 stop:1026 length:663 start_codon:yes stop_codon:yes gene_type:complete